MQQSLSILSITESHSVDDMVCYRPFADKLSLIDVFLKQFCAFEPIHLASHHPDNLSSHNHSKVNVLPIDPEEAKDTGTVIKACIKSLPGDAVCLIKMTAPMLKPQTVKEAIQHFHASGTSILRPVVASHDIFFDTTYKPINEDATVFDSKLRKALYRVSNAFVIFSKSQFLESPTPLLKEQHLDPEPFLISSQEACMIEDGVSFATTQACFKQANDSTH